VYGTYTKAAEIPDPYAVPHQLFHLPVRQASLLLIPESILPQILDSGRLTVLSTETGMCPAGSADFTVNVPVTLHQAVKINYLEHWPVNLVLLKDLFNRQIFEPDLVVLGSSL
jgi:hypothetical protein